VYAVCSLQPEEGEQRLQAAIGRLGLCPDPVRPAEVPTLEAAITASGALRTTPALWPQHGGLDGFFIARLYRPAA
jgi:16S rRNA (cytosine967-C5)-methyltransferase